MYQIALHGSEVEKTAGAKILCGASLRSGWNIQKCFISLLFMFQNLI
ncbi:hypothetical protein TIFTF001_056729, partial [Ficus carica]